MPSQVATNNPSYLDGKFGDAIAFLQIRFRRDFPPAPLAAMHVTPRGGRLLVVADHSIFINEMMLQPDLDNGAFAFNVGRWLADTGSANRRTEVLFYEDGRIQTDFSGSLEVPVTPPIPLEALVPLADETVAQLEQENAFNNILLEAVGGPDRIMQMLVMLLTVALILFGLYRFLQSRVQPAPKAYAASADTADQPAISALERRHEAVMAQGNLAEAARELAHQAFASIGLTPGLGATAPKVTLSGPWWIWLQGRRWQPIVDELWALAVRGPVRRISPTRLRSLDASVHELLAAVAAGKVRLAAANSPI